MVYERQMFHERGDNAGKTVIRLESTKRRKFLRINQKTRVRIDKDSLEQTK